jgi:hypothetical protein
MRESWQLSIMTPNASKHDSGFGHVLAFLCVITYLGSRASSLREQNTQDFLLPLSPWPRIILWSGSCMCKITELKFRGQLYAGADLRIRCGRHRQHACYRDSLAGQGLSACRAGRMVADKQSLHTPRARCRALFETKGLHLCIR